jgi:addiction module HigA family antidote
MSPEMRAAWEAALAPIHPGEILEEEFLKPAGMSRNALALAIGVAAPRINEIVLGKRAITADTALRLGTYFSVSPEFWLGIQAQYDLAMTKLKMREDLGRIRPRELAHA